MCYIQDICELWTFCLLLLFSVVNLWLWVIHIFLVKFLICNYYRSLICLNIIVFFYLTALSGLWDIVNSPRCRAAAGRWWVAWLFCAHNILSVPIIDTNLKLDKRHLYDLYLCTVRLFGQFDLWPDVRSYILLFVAHFCVHNISRSITDTKFNFIHTTCMISTFALWGCLVSLTLV